MDSDDWDTEDEDWEVQGDIDDGNWENNDDGLSDVDISTKIVYAIHQEFIYVQGIRISPFDCPECLNIINEGTTNDYIDCSECEFFSPSDCKLNNNPMMIQDLRNFFRLQLEVRFLRDERQEETDKRINILYHELKSHGRPLHFSVLAKILADRYPQLKFSGNRIYMMMARYPKKFNKVDMGIYEAI